MSIRESIFKKLNAEKDYIRPMSLPIFLQATDGVQLEGILFKPSGIPEGAILIAPGLGIPKEFYCDYCAFLADFGYASFVFDYRGIGKSDINKVNSEKINLRNWGLIDMPCALDFLKKTFPQQKLYLIGHSIGGQLAGLMPNHHLLERIIMISTTGGYWRLFDFPLNLFSVFMWSLHIPITTRIVGYLPKSLTYRGVRIAKGVAQEWAAWSLKKAYIAHYFGRTIPSHCYADINIPIDNIYFADDEIATPRAIRSMMEYYTNVRVKEHLINPKLDGQSRVGHSGFFSLDKGEYYWQMPLQIIGATLTNY